jgi:hypothetical protein
MSKKEPNSSNSSAALHQLLPKGLLAQLIVYTRGAVHLSDLFYF